MKSSEYREMEGVGRGEGGEQKGGGEGGEMRLRQTERRRRNAGTHSGLEP